MPGPPAGFFRAHKSERRRGGEAISLHIFIRDAPDRPSRTGEEEFFDGHSKNVDSKKIWDVVIALDEFGVQRKKNQEQRKVQNGETQRADEHRGDQVAPEKSN